MFQNWNCYFGGYHTVIQSFSETNISTCFRNYVLVDQLIGKLTKWMESGILLQTNHDKTIFGWVNVLFSSSFSVSSNITIWIYLANPPTKCRFQCETKGGMVHKAMFAYRKVSDSIHVYPFWEVQQSQAIRLILDASLLCLSKIHCTRNDGQWNSFPKQKNTP